MVTTVRYIVPTNDQIIVDEQTTMHWPSNTNWDRKVHDWIDAGNTIDPYDPHYGIDTEQIRANKYLLNADLADGQIEVAQSNPVQGVQLDERETRKAAARRDNRAHQQNGITDQDDALADHIELIYDAQDQADDAVENMTRAQLIAYDGSSISWPTWTPPTG